MPADGSFDLAIESFDELLSFVDAGAATLVHDPDEVEQGLRL